MAIQTTVSNDPTIAVEGMFAEGGPRDIISKKAAVAIMNGRFVTQGTADDQCKLPTVTGDVTGKPLGLAVYDASLTPAWPASTGEPYPIGSGVSILRKGRAWVKVEEAVAPFDPVFVRFAAGGGGTALGAFRKSADTATAVQLPGAVYLTTALANGLAVVEFNLP